MLQKERELNVFITRLYTELDQALVDEISLRIRKALDERSGQALKVLDLQNFLENNFEDATRGGQHSVDIAKDLLIKAYMLHETPLSAEETETNQRLLKILHEQFTTHYQGFDGNFDEWLEIRGLSFEDDRFNPVYYGKKESDNVEVEQPKRSVLQQVFQFFNRAEVNVPKDLYEGVHKLVLARQFVRANKHAEEFNSKIEKVEKAALDVSEAIFQHERTFELEKLRACIILNFNDILLNRDKTINTAIILLNKYRSLLNKGGSCIEKALPGEPIFILRGQDRTAWKTVRFWLKKNATKIKFNKYADADEIKRKMKKFPGKRQAD